MKLMIGKTTFAAVIGALLASDAKTAIKYLGSRLVVRATWRHRPQTRHTREEMVVTFGAPNFLERKFIKDCFAAGENLPVKKIQLRPWPQKRAKK
jgi:hypothetical protein